MTTETILTDREISQVLSQKHLLACPDNITAYDVAAAREIEQAVLQSEQVQAWKRDAERIEWLEEQTKKSYTGISFDYYRHVEDGYVLDHGYRFMRRHFASGFKDSLRKAIDAAMEKQK